MPHAARPRWRAPSAALPPLTLLLGVAGCGGREPLPPYAVDCAPPAGVELRRDLLFNFEDTGENGSQWYWFGDRSHGAYPPWRVVPDPLPEDTEPDEEAGDDTDEVEEPDPPGYLVTESELDNLWRCGKPPPAQANGTAVFYEPIPDGQRCESTAALPLFSCGHNDWGAGFSTWALRESPGDGSDWEGLALWARAGDPSDRVVTFLIEDRFGSSDGTVVDPETGESQATCRPPLEFGSNCENDKDDDGDSLQDCKDPDCCGSEVCGCGEADCATMPGCNGTPLETEMTVCPRDADGEVHCVVIPKVIADVESAASQTIEGVIYLGNELPDRYDCGNNFSVPLTVTDRWQLYLLPFADFVQPRAPNWAPAGMDTSGIHGLIVRTPPEAHVELWLDDVTFYRRSE